MFAYLWALVVGDIAVRRLEQAVAVAPQQRPLLERSDSVANHSGSCEDQDSDCIPMEVYGFVESSEAPQT